MGVSTLPSLFGMTMAMLALINCGPINFMDERLANRILTDNSNMFAISPESEFLVRQIRKDNSRSPSVFEPYLMFKQPPAPEMTVMSNSKLVLSCEVSGSPKPMIYWQKNGRLFNQTFNGRFQDDESHIGQLSLSLVSSRLYLNCLPDDEPQAIYTCVGETKFKRIMTHTKLTVLPALAAPLVVSSVGDNSIDSSFGPSSDCSPKSSFGSPARIYFNTVTTLENIGSAAVISCRAIGSPKPQISWTDSSDQIVVPDQIKYHILPSGDLLIQNVTFDDMGRYKCAAVNEFGIDSVEKIFFYPTEPMKDNNGK